MSGEDFTQTVQEDIDRDGFSVIYIEDSGPSFAYTVGLWRTYKHAEFIVFGLPGQVMANLLHAVAQRVKEGQRFASHAFLAGLGSKFGIEVSPISQTPLQRYFGFAIDFYGEEMPAAQIIWPDSDGRFPANPEYNRAYEESQPVLK
jgi:hypothetical protein